MSQRSLVFQLIMYWLAIGFPLLIATAAGPDVEQRSGSGWVGFMPLPESPDYAFIRQYLENDEDYQSSQAPPSTPWPIDELSVGYWDLNDDGVEEMFLSFAEVSSFYCGTGGCSMTIFEKRDGNWQVIIESSGFHVWVSDEKRDFWINGKKYEGYRRTYSRNVCEPIDPAERSKIPEFFITNLSC